MIIIMLGAPGVGKGTQAIKISNKYGIPNISVGDIFREHIKNNTFIGKEIKSYVSSGILVPDEVVCKILFERIKEDDCKKGYILDGFPRNIKQAELLKKELKKLNCNIDYVINIEVDEDVIINRLSSRRVCVSCGSTYNVNELKNKNVCLKCGDKLIIRADDNTEIIKNRFKEYNEQTQQLIDYYTKSNLLKTINGLNSIEEVFNDINNIINIKEGN